jgi:membrane peptidoglycan carboxypeptidase
VTDAMERVVAEGTGQGAQALGRPAAGKTGTTDKTLAVWFDGFTPQLAAAVGIYKGDGTVPITVKNGRDISSGGVPVDIWTAFMKGALLGAPVLDFPPRAGLGDSALPPPPPPPTTAPPTTLPPAPTTTSAPPQPTRTRPTFPGPTRTRPTGPPRPTLTVPPSAVPGVGAPAGAP